MLTILYRVRDRRCNDGTRIKVKTYTGNNVDKDAVGVAALHDPKRVSNWATVCVEGTGFNWNLNYPDSWVTTKADYKAYIESLNGKRKEVL